MIDPDIGRRLAPAFAAAGALTGCIAGGAVLGLAADTLLGTRPVFAGLLAFTGLIVGVRQAARLARPR
jgi:F0F1-type ATP synthase assembly protein I